MSISIIPMTQAHISACAEILSSTALWRETYGVTMESATQTFRKGLDDPLHSLCIAVDGSETVIGLAYYTQHGAFYYGSYLRLLAVHEAHRGRRIGQQLLHYVEEQVRAETPLLFLLAEENNTRAQHFYIREGYQQVGTLPNFVIPGVTEYIFQKRLT